MKLKSLSREFRFVYIEFQCSEQLRQLYALFYIINLAEPMHNCTAAINFVDRFENSFVIVIPKILLTLPYTFFCLLKCHINYVMGHSLS